MARAALTDEQLQAKKAELEARVLQGVGDLFQGVCLDCDPDPRLDMCEAPGGQCFRLYDDVNGMTPGTAGELKRAWTALQDVKRQLGE